jgi:hypothetical protein
MCPRAQNVKVCIAPLRRSRTARGYCVSYVQFCGGSYLYIRQTGVGECQGHRGGAERRPRSREVG